MEESRRECPGARRSGCGSRRARSHAVSGSGSNVMQDWQDVGQCNFGGNLQSAIVQQKVFVDSLLYKNE